MLVITPFPGFVRIKPVITTGLKYVETQKTQQQPHRCGMADLLD